MATSMEVQITYTTPSDARLRDGKTGMAGFDVHGRLCWTLVKSQLSVWGAEQEDSTITSASLPYAVPHALVSTLAVKDSQSTACIVCTPEGNIFAWPKLSQSQDQEPLQARISQEITCLSDIIVVEHQPTLAIFAILGTADGRLYKLDCINPGTSTEAIAVIPLQPEKGLLGAFGQFWGKRVLPGAKAAVTALQLLSDGQDVQILALSKPSLDCWQMSMQPGSSAQILWSLPVLNTMQQQNQNLQQLSCCSLSAIPMSSSRHNVAVLASMGGDTVVLHLLSVSTKSRPEEISTHLLQLSSDAGSKLSQTDSRWCCCCGRYNEVMIWRRGGTLYRWTLQTGPVQQELPGAISSAVAVTSDTESPHWLVLTSTQTVVLPMAQPKAARSVAPRVIPQAPPTSQPHDAAHSQGQGAGLLSAANAAAGMPQDQVFQLLSAAVYRSAEDPQRQHSLQQLRQITLRLQEPPGPTNDVAVFSNRVIDTLPKQWGRASAADYLQQLQDKQMYHQTLLTTIVDMQLMHILDPKALRAIFESAEKLEAVSAVREYENLQRGSNPTEPSGVLQDVIFDAGRTCASQASGAFEQRPEQEVFYSCPSLAAEAFFEAVSNQLAILEGEGSPYAGNLERQLEQTLEVAQAVQNVLGKAHARNQELTQAYQREMYRIPPDMPWWSAGLPVRNALQGVADTLSRLVEALKPGNASYFEKCANWLLTMSEAVLSAYTHAMNSCQAAGPLLALKQDYERARNGYLHRLLDIAADLEEGGVSTNLVQAVEQLADAHRAYPQLFRICEEHQDENKLHAYMLRHRIMVGSHLDLDHSAVSHVFDRLLEDGQHARLLSFPDQFNQDLGQWLHTRLAAAGAQRDTAATLRRLTWLHELRMQKYDSASRTLADVTNNNEGSVATVHRAACIAKLSKLASVAGSILKPTAEDLEYVSHQHAKIMMLQVQTALKLDPGQVHEFHHLLTACLHGDRPATEAAQEACYVFLLLRHAKSPDQQISYRQEFDAAWQRAAAETDWQQLADSSPQASDQEVNSTLCQTQLCHAAQICYADPAHSLAQAFPLETVLDMMLEVTGSKQDPVMKNLVEAALLHGYHGQYMAPQQLDEEPGSPIDMQAD